MALIQRNSGRQRVREQAVGGAVGAWAGLERDHGRGRGRGPGEAFACFLQSRGLSL